MLWVRIRIDNAAGVGILMSEYPNMSFLCIMVHPQHMFAWEK